MSAAVEANPIVSEVNEVKNPSTPTAPLSSSLPNNDGPLNQIQNSTRRSSLAAPPGIPQPKGIDFKNEAPFPKITRAASVSFLPQIPRSDNMDELTYLRQLAAATAQLQGEAALSAGLRRPELWGLDRNRTSSWAGLPENAFASQQEYIKARNDSFIPLRRMSYNPVGMQPSRGRNMSAFRGSVLSAFEEDNNSTSPDSGPPRPFGYNSSRRGSASSATPGNLSEKGFSEEYLQGMESRFPRRYSLAPQFVSDWDYDGYLSSQMETLAMENYAALLNRRHSVAASAFPVRRPSPPNSVDSQEGGSKQLHTLAEIDDENNQYAGYKADILPTILSHHFSEKYFVVEFKGSRTDVYYTTPESLLRIKIGDLVIVEADRGKDLGKVVQENITPEELASIQHEQRLNAGDTPRNFDPKKIFRHAQPSEISLLLTKVQDETRALELCRSKIKQHNLPMEIADAEYQWDRRKLTFFYNADERVDFRELVRELFKMYKTRIWMCAVPK